MLCSSMLRFGMAVALAAVTLAACGGTGAPTVMQSNTATSGPAPTTTVESVATSTTPVDTTVVDTTTPTTIADTTTTEAAVTTTSPPLTAADLVIRADGIGPLVFGAPAEVSIAVFTGVLGAPIVDESTSYPNEPTPGQFESVEGDFGFSHPFERLVCYNNGLCATFGGAAADRLAFVGWELVAGNPPPLLTTAGVTIGSRWADFTGVMTVAKGGCYTTGYGQTAGVNMVLESSGEWFDKVDDAGNHSAGDPDPADVTVTGLNAGNLRIFLYGDC
jgi:hypothetical protein